MGNSELLSFAEKDRNFVQRVLLSGKGKSARHFEEPEKVSFTPKGSSGNYSTRKLKKDKYIRRVNWKTFGCEMCGKTASKKSQMIFHLLKGHNIKFDGYNAPKKESTLKKNPPKKLAQGGYAPRKKVQTTVCLKTGQY